MMFTEDQLVQVVDATVRVVDSVDTAIEDQSGIYSWDHSFTEEGFSINVDCKEFALEQVRSHLASDDLDGATISVVELPAEEDSPTLVQIVVYQPWFS